MATEVSSMPVNGTYGSHHSYGVDQQPQQNHNIYPAGQQSFTQAPPASTTPATTASSVTSEIPKDEVGWYFVEQYYTTLSRQPEKLYLYYNKRSQYVSGNETDKVQVCVGQRAINDRIKELDFQDCKVRITNVDSQASDHNIVIQVIGEISNRSQPHRKFTQTFVLATQTNGYFVLNDIFRYIIEEEDEPELPASTNATEEVQQVPAAESEHREPPATAEETEPKTLSSSIDAAAVEHDAKEVDNQLEEKLLPGQAKDAPAELNGSLESEPKDAPQPAAVAPAAELPAEPKAASQAEEPERPTEPEPTPAASPPKPTAPEPSALGKPKPAVPKTWASMAASAHKTAAPVGAAGSAPQPQPQPQSQSQSQRPTPPTKPSAPAAPSSTAPSVSPAPPATTPSAPPHAPAGQRDEATTGDSQDEWTAVGGSHNRQQSRQANGLQPDGPLRRGYIKNVHENIQGPELREALEKHGKVTYFDIARQKNCAFVDFETAEAYQAAVAANPHLVGSDRFYVEERKLRPGSTPYVPRGQYQGGRGGGRGDFRGGRGGFVPRGRGGQGGARGARGGAQQPAQ